MGRLVIKQRSRIKTCMLCQLVVICVLTLDLEVSPNQVSSLISIQNCTEEFT